MNENPGGTPSPLNENPAPQPVAGPAPQPEQPVPPVAPVPPVEPATPAQPASVDMAAALGTTPAGATATVDSTTAPADQTAAGGEKKPATKKIALFAAIGLFVAAIVCAVIAVIVANPFKQDDRVPQAISKLLSGDAPKNIEAQGKIIVNTDSEDTNLRALTIDLDAKFATAYRTNTAEATVSALFADETELSFGAQEIMVADGDVYLNINSLSDSLSSDEAGGETVEAGEENCEADENGETNCEVVEVDVTTCDGDACEVVEGDAAGDTGYLGELIDYFGLVDDTWIRIPANIAEAPEDETGIFNNESQCLVNAISNLPNYSNSLTESYKANQFIEYSTENLGIAQVANNLYRLSFNEEKLTNFINEMTSSAFMNELLACTGDEATNTKVSVDDVKEVFSGFPTIYVEIDENYNFTRVVFEAKLEEQASEITADFNLTYPDVITINEPTEYIDLNEFLTELFGNLYDVTTDDTTEVIEDE